MHRANEGVFYIGGRDCTVADRCQSAMPLRVSDFHFPITVFHYREVACTVADRCHATSRFRFPFSVFHSLALALTLALALAPIGHGACATLLFRFPFPNFRFPFPRKSETRSGVAPIGHGTIVYCANSLSRLRLRVGAFIFALRNIALGGYLD